MAFLARSRGLLAAVVAAGLTIGLSTAWVHAQPVGGGRGGERGGERGAGGGGGPRFGGGMGGPMGGMFGRNMFEPAVTSRSLETYSKMLGLDSDQQTAAKALLEGYQQSFADLADKARDTMASMREEMRNAFAEGGPDPELFRKMGDEFTKFRKSGTELEQGFFNDLKAVLTPEQTQKWTSVERLHRRETSLGRGLLAGERVDLFKLVDDAKLTPEARKSLDQILSDYEAELDREIVARNAAYDAAQGRIREFFQDPSNPDAMKAFEDGRTASLRLREVNRKYARQIEGLLPEESRAAFAASFRRESYPEIHRPTYASRALDAAAAMADLDEAQKASISSIRESYTRDLNAVNREMEEARDKRETSGKLEDLMPRRWGGGGRDDGDPLRERRMSLQDAVIEKLRSVLTPDQFAALPERRGEWGGGEGRGRRGEDDGVTPRRRERENRPAAPRSNPNPGPT